MTWIIGDIHGCLRELNMLLSEIPVNDKLVFLGDYVDRGPDSMGVIDRLIQEKHRSYFLMGNHEDLMINYMKGETNSWHLEINGGKETLDSYGLSLKSKFNDLPAAHQEFFDALEMYLDFDDFLAVHAGINSSRGIDPHKQSKTDLLWIRHLWLNHINDWKGKYVYFGHTPTIGIHATTAPVFYKNACAVDTGCVYGGKLTAIRHRDHKVIQIQSKTSWSFLM